MNEEVSNPAVKKHKKYNFLQSLHTNENYISYFDLSHAIIEITFHLILINPTFNVKYITVYMTDKISSTLLKKKVQIVY